MTKDMLAYLSQEVDRELELLQKASQPASAPSSSLKRDLSQILVVGKLFVCINIFFKFASV